MKNLVCNEKFGINCASAEAQFGTGRGIMNWILNSIIGGPDSTFKWTIKMYRTGLSVSRKVFHLPINRSPSTSRWRWSSSRRRWWGGPRQSRGASRNSSSAPKTRRCQQIQNKNWNYFEILFKIHTSKKRRKWQSLIFSLEKLAENVHKSDVSMFVSAVSRYTVKI